MFICFYQLLCRRNLCQEVAFPSAFAAHIVVAPCILVSPNSWTFVSIAVPYCQYHGRTRGQNFWELGHKQYKILNYFVVILRIPFSWAHQGAVTERCAQAECGCTFYGNKAVYFVLC